MGEYLAGCGYSVLGIRLAAHATRPEDMIRVRWRDWLASVEDGWHILSGCTERIYVMGLSLGGILSLLFAADHPVAGVVAMATPHHLPADWRVRFIKPLSLFLKSTLKSPGNYYDPEAFADHVCYPVDPTRAYAEVRDAIVEMQRGLPRVSAPVLLIYSRQDETVRAQDKHLESIYQALGSDDKRYLWIEGSSHVITCDAKRQEVFQAAHDFIEDIEASP